MIRGHLDALTTGGVAEGWAFDDAAPDRVLTVRLLGPDGEELGLGFAGQYRGDLAEIRFRHGWCAFRLRLSRGEAELRGQRLRLVEAGSGQPIHEADAWGLREAAEDAPCTTLEAVIAQDPTVVGWVEQLSGCGELLAGFVARHGVAEFVRAAYAYMLGRPADPTGQAAYERLLRQGALTPFGLLLLLADSGEFRSQPRLLASPAGPGFVFAE